MSLWYFIFRNYFLQLVTINKYYYETKGVKTYKLAVIFLLYFNVRIER